MPQRNIQILCILLALLLCFSACSGEAESAQDGDISSERSTNPDAVTLTLACWVPAESILLAVDRFNAAQSDYRVEIVSYYSDRIDPYVGLARMNAELIAGNRADLYDLNGMNVTGMVNAGLLLDMYPLMSSDQEFNIDDYFSNIWALMEHDGALYQLAPAFSICGVAGPSGMLPEGGWDIPEYLSLMRQSPDLYAMRGKTQTIILSECIRYGLDRIVDENAYTCQFASTEFYNCRRRQLPGLADPGVRRRF